MLILRHKPPNWLSAAACMSHCTYMTIPATPSLAAEASNRSFSWNREPASRLDAVRRKDQGTSQRAKGKGRNERRKNLQVTVEFHCSLVSSTQAILRAAISFSPLSHQLLPPAWPNPVMMLGPRSDTCSLPVTIVTISPRCLLVAMPNIEIKKKNSKTPPMPHARFCF